MTDDRSLDELRREIDAIDDRIHDDLMRRTEIVGRIAAVKRHGGNSALALRPGREALILRRLAARHKGAFPLPALLRMWRELLAGQVAIQGGLTVGVVTSDGGAERTLSRDHFGASTPLQDYASAERAIEAVRSRKVSVGVVPVPRGEPEDAWWRGLASDANAPRIVAKLPFWEDAPPDADPAAAWVIAKLAPDAMGDDVTVASVEGRGAWRMNDLAAAPLAIWRSRERGRACRVVEIDGLHTLETLRARFGHGGEVAALGSYARPIRIVGPGMTGPAD